MMNSRASRDDGFSLIEMMVGIFIGAIVLTMVIYVLFSTNTAGVKLLSKQQVSQSTRVAMNQLLKDLGSGQSMLDCIVWKSTEDQLKYQEYVANPSGPLLVDSEDCLEYFENGRVLTRASYNSLCWNKDVTEEDGVVDFQQEPLISCLTRGGSGVMANYDGSAVAGSLSCTIPPGTEEDTLYYFECEATSQYSYFVKSEATTTFTYKSNSIRPVLDLAPGTDNESVAEPFRKNLFSYEKTSGETPNLSDPQNTAGIEFVHVNLDVLYKVGTNNTEGVADMKTYKFAQSVVMQGARTFAEQGAYADQFVGG